MEPVSRFDIRRGRDRARTSTDWLDSRHSFAFADHYQPDNTSFGLLLAHNCDVLQPGPGYPPHAHRNLEILTWVLDGALTHHDLSGGASTAISTGQLQYVSAGSGIRHTEASAGSGPVRLVQMWLSPDELDAEPGYQLLEVADRLGSGELVPVASGLDGAGDRAGGALCIRQRAAALSVARLTPGSSVRLPAAPYVHVFVTAGTVTVEPAGDDAVWLQAGDALRITDRGGELVEAGDAAELLVWTMHASLT